MENTYPKGFRSSEDPSGQTLSLTVSSLVQMVISLVAFYAVHKGLDPAVATSQVQGLIDLVVNAVPAGMVVYHAINVCWGACRKILSLLKKSPTVSAEVQA